MKYLDDFVVFILTHGRADNVYTYKALKRAGYTGKIILVIDNEDEDATKYYNLYGNDNVYMFDKLSKSKEVDSMDLSCDRNAILYARCACFDIAKELNYKYFLELDDDYTNFRSRIVVDGSLKTVYIKNFDELVDCVIDFLEISNAHTVALSQIGDFIGGKNSKVCKDRLTRKAMNAFFCKTDKKFNWIGKMNEDVTTYITLGSRGYLFFTVADVSIDQLSTQSLSGGMSDEYLSYGTYTKTFYTVISCPSCVKVYTMGVTNKRFHHIIDWDKAVPKIISEKYRKRSDFCANNIKNNRISENGIKSN